MRNTLIELVPMTGTLQQRSRAKLGNVLECEAGEQSVERRWIVVDEEHVKRSARNMGSVEKTKSKNHDGRKGMRAR